MKFEERDAFLAHMKALEGDGQNDAVTYEVTRHHPFIGDAVLGCEGGCTVEEDPDDMGKFHFEITIGPANARRLVDFLRALPDEPEYDDTSGRDDI